MPQPGHVVKIELPPEDRLDADIRTSFGKCREKLGLVPNVLRAYTGNPAKFRAFAAFYNQPMLDEEACGLSKLEREMIAVVVSSANRCYYCLVAHGQAVRELSGDPELGEMMVMNYRIAELEPRRRAMLDFAWTLTLSPGDIGESDRQRLRDVGFSDRDIFDICDVAAFFNYTNRMAHGLEMIPNREYHAMSR
ncbi:MAG TPA: peroxidase-related enzyme [Rhodospirillales bacterium]|nr:peroxidase-related enzyme [Rhodospirillales bacterium]